MTKAKFKSIVSNIGYELSVSWLNEPFWRSFFEASKFLSKNKSKEKRSQKKGMNRRVFGTDKSKDTEFQRFFLVFELFLYLNPVNHSKTNKAAAGIELKKPSHSPKNYFLLKLLYLHLRGAEKCRCHL